MLEPRRLATRAAARRMADLLGEQVGGTVGYQTRDERRIGADDADRGRHRGHPHPPPAERPRAAGRRARDLRRGPRAQPADRPRPGVGARRRAPRSGPTSACWRCRRRRTPRHWPRVLGDDPVVESSGRSYPVDIRWRPIERRARGSKQAVSAVDPIGAARRRPATCSCSCPASARSAASKPACGGTLAERRRRAAARRRAVARRAGPRPSRRRRPVGAASCCRPTSPRRRSPSPACASSSTPASRGRRASTRAPA